MKNENRIVPTAATQWEDSLVVEHGVVAAITRVQFPVFPFEKVTTLRAKSEFKKYPTNRQTSEKASRVAQWLARWAHNP